MAAREPTAAASRCYQPPRQGSAHPPADGHHWQRGACELLWDIRLPGPSDLHRIHGEVLMGWPPAHTRAATYPPVTDLLERRDQSSFSAFLHAGRAVVSASPAKGVLEVLDVMLTRVALRRGL